MRIAQIAPIIESVPPKKYGGTERVVHTLTEELVKKGHDVTLFATADSITSAKLISVVPKSLREMFPKNKMQEVYGMNYWTIMHIALAYQMQDKFDVIHDHTGHYGLLAANIAQIPVVMTLHGAFDDQNKILFQSMKNPNFVTISDAQGLPVPKLNRLGTVYNGLNMKNYPFSDTHDGYLLFVGRISEEKGVHLAIDLAQRVGMQLIIAAKLDFSNDPDVAYFRKFIKHRLSDKIRWVGEVNEEERNKLMSKAKAFIHPVTWPEPFGLTLIEAMACGAPVIAMAKGSIPEVIQDGKSGFVVNTLDEMVEAVKKIDQIDRAYASEYAKSTFGAERMARGYLSCYNQAIEKNRQNQLLRKQKQEVAPLIFPQRNFSPKAYPQVYSQNIRPELKALSRKDED